MTKGSLLDLCQSIKKETYKKEHIMDIRIKTGCKLLDMVTGGAKNVHGFPVGRFINIVGDKSAGKTFLSNEIIASAFHEYGKAFKWVYDDCESGYSFDTQEMYGFDIMPKDPDKVVQSTTVEEAFCNISNFAKTIKKDQFGIYVLDSLDGLTSAEQDEQANARLKAFDQGKDYDKGSYNMGKPKYLSREFFPQLCNIVQSKNILIIIISQVRENIDMFSFEKFTRSGGKALDFYAHMVLWLATAKKIVKKERAVGVVVKAKVTKGKVPRPYRECFFSFLYDYGLDDVGTCIDYLFDLRTPKGELNALAKAVRWNEGKKIAVNPLKAWLKEQELQEDFMDSPYYDGKVTVDSVMEYLEHNKDAFNKFQEEFGSSMNREELIEYIENNNLIDELHRRTEEKWEALEDQIKTTRAKKYATQPKGD